MNKVILKSEIAAVVALLRNDKVRSRYSKLLILDKRYLLCYSILDRPVGIMNRGYKMSKKAIKKGTKARILGVTMKLFNEKGYANTSINEVCRRAKVSKGALYYHFKSKEDLLFTFMDSFFEDYYNQMEPLMQKAKTPSDQIRIMIDISFKFINPEMINPVFWLSLLNEGKNIKGRIAGYFDDTYFGFRTELKKLITQGKKSGEFRKDLDSKTIAVIITGVIEGIGIQFLFDTKRRLKLNSIKKKTTEYILDMLEVSR